MQGSFSFIVKVKRSTNVCSSHTSKDKNVIFIVFIKSMIRRGLFLDIYYNAGPNYLYPSFSSLINVVALYRRLQHVLNSCNVFLNKHLAKTNKLEIKSVSAIVYLTIYFCSKINFSIVQKLILSN